MNKEQLDEYEKVLFSSISHQTRRILEKEPIEQLNLIVNDLRRAQRIELIEKQNRRIKASCKKPQNEVLAKNPLDNLLKLLDKLIEDLTAQSKKSKNEKEYWNTVEFNISNSVSYQIQTSFSKYLTYSFIQGLLTDKFNRTLNEKYRKNIRADFDLKRNGDLQKALFTLLKPLFRDEIKHGGSKASLDEPQKLQFLAHYNRYLIVIKNARNEKRKLKKLNKSDIIAKREAMAKYEIPERLINSAFSSDIASEVALEWAIETLEVNHNFEYSKSLLNKIRKQYGQKFFIVDVDFTIGRRIYAVHPRNNQRQIEKLRYTPLEKPNEIIIDDPDNFLIEWNG